MNTAEELEWFRLMEERLVDRAELFNRMANVYTREGAMTVIQEMPSAKEMMEEKHGIER